MVRSTFAKFVQYPVDMIGCSSGLDDEIFVNTIDSFFNNTQYKYDVIFVQMGHHGRINKSGNHYSEEDYHKFAQDYKALLNFLFQHTNKIIVESIFDAIIPCKYPKIKNMLIILNIHRLFYKLGIIKEQPDNEINKVTHRKNQIIKDLIASSFNSQNINYYDINMIMKNSYYVHVDHIHFEEKAKYYIAAQMATNL